VTQPIKCQSGVPLALELHFYWKSMGLKVEEVRRSNMADQ
jgi:hypothetical protein